MRRSTPSPVPAEMGHDGREGRGVRATSAGSSSLGARRLVSARMTGFVTPASASSTLACRGSLALVGSVGDHHHGVGVLGGGAALAVHVLAEAAVGLVDAGVSTTTKQAVGAAGRDDGEHAVAGGLRFRQTMERPSPTRALSRVLLPTLGRPTRATTPAAASGGATGRRSVEFHEGREDTSRAPMRLSVPSIAVSFWICSVFALAQRARPTRCRAGGRRVTSVVRAPAAWGPRRSFRRGVRDGRGRARVQRAVYLCRRERQRLARTLGEATDGALFELGARDARAALRRRAGRAPALCDPRQFRRETAAHRVARGVPHRPDGGHRRRVRPLRARGAAARRPSRPGRPGSASRRTRWWASTGTTRGATARGSARGLPTEAEWSARPAAPTSAPSPGAGGGTRGAPTTAPSARVPRRRGRPPHTAPVGPYPRAPRPSARSTWRAT